LWCIPEVKCGILDFYRVVVLAVGDSLEASKVFV
jgi:hypothetical protein